MDIKEDNTSTQETDTRSTKEIESSVRYKLVIGFMLLSAAIFFIYVLISALGKR